MEHAMTSEDRWYANRIPDDFVASSGDAISRISKIVTENWWHHGANALSQLVEPLLPILEPLASTDGEVSDHHRNQCQAVVERWLAQQ
ncbi:MAG: hypothetical protein JSW71_13120 [Gemmatimonadota bacterium]|nr:MAG: hypothetical protein JSW71_13120 [Gemmatimonadota bacterium]